MQARRHAPRYRCWKNTTSCVVICAMLCRMGAAPAWAAIEIASGPPQGFEQLEAPRPTAITVFYGGDMLGTFPAHFTPGSVQFDKPSDITALIPTLKHPQKIMTALSQPMPAHTDLLCTDKHTDACGLLKPDVAGIIFNENQLSAELFINADELLLVDKNAERFLPLPDQHFSSVYGFSGAVAGAAQQANNYTLTNTATFSEGEARLETQSTAANQGFRVDTFAGDVERNGWDTTAGLFRSQAMQLLSDRDIAGVSLETSTRTYLDDHKTEGNDIILYLPHHALVSIYREGRLYSSNAYDAGNQRIDASELPDGAYPITLRIQEADGTVREETRFFAKTQEIPPADKPVYYAQLGVIRQPASMDNTIPQLTGHPIARFGTVRRAGDNLGLNLGFLGTSDRVAMEDGIFWVGDGKKFGATALASTHGDYGVQANYLHYLNKFSASIDARKTWLSSTPMPGFEDQLHGYAQLSASLSYAVTNNVNVGARGSYSQQAASPTSTTYGPHAEWRIWQRNENTFGMTADVTRSNGRTDGAILFNLTIRMGEYGMTSSGGMGLVNSQTTPIANARVFHDDQTPDNALLLGAGVSTDNQQKVISSDANWRNHFGQLQGSVQDSFGRAGSLASYGGNFNFNAAQLSDEVHMGGTQSEKSAVIIEANGDASAQDMKIFVNGTERSTVQVDTQQVLYLSPFNTYRIHISPATPGLFDYQAGDRKVTLYPGNVTKLSWDVNKFYVVAARIVTATGQPLNNAILQESHAQATTDENGRVQAELSAPKTLTFASADNHTTCSVQLPPNVKPINGVLIYSDALPCAPLNASNQIASQ
jgi:hypothetical protein